MDCTDKLKGIADAVAKLADGARRLEERMDGVGANGLYDNKGPYRLEWHIGGKKESFRYATEAQAKEKARWFKRNGHEEVKLFKAVEKSE